ncbi:MAG: hypothetical protein OEZ43_06265 [Gammaproteobacteria bacterium]|nr:hypothetical protein [Gammaproteobacteria bacterium]
MFFRLPGMVALFNLAGLALLYFIFLDRFELSLLFEDTILTGGDSASWYQIAWHMKHELLPYGRVFGWSQDNYFGYDNLLHYFVLPFLAIVLLSFIIPLTISLKLISFLGVLLLPLAVFWMLKRIGYKTPLPLIGAALSFYFLLHEQFRIFGGNLLSTLAGEFCFSLAFVLFTLFIGNLHRGIDLNSRLVSNALLLAAIGLSHAFVFFSAALLPVFYLLQRHGLRQRLPYVLKIYGLAFLLMAFWSLPMLDMREFTTQVNMVWYFTSWRDFLNNLGIIPIVIFISGAVLTLIPATRNQRLSLFVFIGGCAVVLYFVANLLRVPDIRFFPAFLFSTILISVEIVYLLASRLYFYRRYFMATLVAMVVLFCGKTVYAPELQSPAWFEWNYSGYEVKPAFRNGVFQELVNELKGDYTRGRVAWEHVDYNPDFGSERVFENLSYFTGRYTTEGIHYAAGLMSKTVTILANEFSLRRGGAEPVMQAQPNVERLGDHFKLFNISQVIAKSTPIEQMFRRSADFELALLSDDYSVFNLRDYTPSFVKPLEYVPPLATIESSHPEAAIRNWFRRGHTLESLFVDRRHLHTPELKEPFTQSVTLAANGKLSELSVEKMTPASVSKEFIDNRTIRFQTDGIGKPHLIKVSFSPLWQSSNGETIYRVAPGMMLLFPQQEKVELVYTRSTAEKVGLLMTLTGLLIILGMRYKETFTERWLERLFLIAPINATVYRLHRPLLILLVVATLLLCWWGASVKRQLLDFHYQGAALSSSQQFQASVNFHQATLDNPEQIDDDLDVGALSMLALARDLIALKQYDRAQIVLQRMHEDYPDWASFDLIYLQQARLALAQNRREIASRVLDECKKRQVQIGVNKSCNNFRESFHVAP